MRIRYLLYNDPSELGKAKERQKIKINYAFPVHNGHRSFSVGKKKRGTVPARAGVKYFERAITKYQKDFERAILDTLDIIIRDNKPELNASRLISKMSDIAERTLQESISIIGNEAKDTGDLQASTKRTNVEVI